MKRPTDKYGELHGGTAQRLLVRGGLLLILAVVIGTLAGWTDRVRATEEVAAANPRLVAREMGSLGDQLDAARGEMALIRLQLDRANAVMENSARYRIPADLAAAIYDIALSEGIDPALGFQLVKIESSFKENARSSAGAIGYTQVQLATARFYDRGVTAKQLFQRDVNLRIGFRFLNDLLGKFNRDTQTALLAYNRGPAKVSEILAQGGDPANGYAEAVLEGYRPPAQQRRAGAN
jgi:soluble lytic murein transglycosylase-like protein